MGRKHYNIMTSCDIGLMKYLPVQLEAIADNMRDQDISFYLLHDDNDRSTGAIDLLKKLCDQYPNVEFVDTAISDPRYDELARYGGKWPGPAYYSLCAHEIIPSSDERVLYLDAGDTLLLKEPYDYYWGDFDEKSLIATSSCGDDNGNRVVYNKDSLNDKNVLPGILQGTFNSGSYVMNLKRIRDIGLSLDDYVELAKSLSKAVGKEREVYFGDQGLLSIVFLGDIKYYGEGIDNSVWYMPNDFCTPCFFEYDGEPAYDINIVHFSTSQKPWQIDMPSGFNYERDHNKLQLNAGVKAFYKYVCIWHEYSRRVNTRN